jgi:uncharacterized protein involved in oxidation of intracellular sulfur
MEEEVRERRKEEQRNKIRMREHEDNGGKIFACATCLKIRQSEGSEMCPLSTMKDLYKTVKESDKIVTFS